MAAVAVSQVPQIRSCATLRASLLDYGAVWVLELSGEADIATESMLGEELAQAAGKNRGHLAVDLTGLRFCDVRSAHLIRRARGTAPVEVTGATGSVLRVFGLLDSLARQPGH